jgi:hypothetical protein
MQLRMRTPAVDPAQIRALMRPALPFFEAWGGGRVRMLRNVDDPSQFVQVVEYELPEAMDINRHRIASDPTLRTFLQTWRTMFGGAVEVDVYEDVTEG